MNEIVELKEKTQEAMYDLVMSICTRLQNGEIDDLGATCIIMDAVHELVKKENLS